MSATGSSLTKPIPRRLHKVSHQTKSQCTFPTRIVPLATLLLFLLATSFTPAHSAIHEIYPPPAQASADIASAIKSAGATHKRVILDFGGNWCEDCHVLDYYFEDSSNKPILDANFVVVHVNIDHQDANLDIAARYHVPIKDGVPALAVLSDHGKLLFSQETGEFKRMRHMESSSVTNFLVQWKPVKPGCSAVQITC